MKMFKKKSAPKVPPLAEMNARLRGFIMDSQIQDAHELSYILGCAPLSDEVAEKEEQVSDDRVEKISFLIPLLYAYSHALAEASIEFQKTHTEGHESVPDEIWIFGRRILEQVSMSALIGSTSQLVDMGLLTIPKRIKK